MKEANFCLRVLLFVLSCAPACYLFAGWHGLPAKLALHLNLQGEVDRWGSKEELVPFVIFPVILYAAFFVLELLRPSVNNSPVYRTAKITIVSVVPLTILAMLISISSHSNP